MIYYPVFGFSPSFYGSTMDDYLRDSISFKKDVEGLSFTYRYNLYRNVRYMDTPPLTKLETLKLIQMNADESSSSSERSETSESETMMDSNSTKNNDISNNSDTENNTETGTVTNTNYKKSILDDTSAIFSFDETNSPDNETTTTDPVLKCLLPCTALSCVKILENIGAYDETLPIGNRMENKIVTIIRWW